MADEEAAAKWALKDALIAIPFLASALALTWEVGYFARIKGGAFGLFSVAEHLTFALKALPIALAVTVMGVGGLAAKSLMKSPGLQGARKIDGILNRYSSLLSWVCFAAGGLSAIWYLSARADSLLIPMLILGLGTAPYLSVIMVPTGLLRHPLIVCVGVVGAFFAALGIGSESARIQIQSSLPLNSIKTGEKGKDIETEIKVRILRTGDRGVLYFDPATQTFGLLPWDYVRRVDWAISTGTK
jgi:hypothetical protein